MSIVPARAAGTACTVCATLLLLLGACAAPGPGGAGVGAERRADSLVLRGEYSDAAALYIDLATRAQGRERERLTLLAAEQWLNAGDGRRAGNAMRSVERPEGGDLLWRWIANTAALALWEGRPDDALALLEPLAGDPLPLHHRARMQALRGDARFQRGEPARAVELYVQRESWLDDEEWLQTSRSRLWQGLRVSDPRSLREAAASVDHPLIRGWLELGALAAATGQRGIGWTNGVERWRESYPGHPGTGVLERLAPVDRGSLDYPARVALLLPLTGSNAAAGQAIRNGFLGAYFAATAGLEDAQTIRLYDVNAGGAPEAYARAVNEGAGFVVGPLLRNSVAALARDSVLPVPLLALNYLPDDRMAPAGFYQFALAPEDEAVSAAERALADGHRRAVALVPNNDWGRRVLRSFAGAFEAGGGVLLDYRDYQPSMQDFSFEIEGLMALTQSVQRYQRLRANIGGPLQFDPRRRQDADLVFLGANANAGRLIRSQLRFHYSGELPVYSTSFIYSMDGRSNSDLNGVMFADTPWVVAPHAWMADLPALYGEYWPGERRLARLHAMGYDAYQLVNELYAARVGPMREISGATGRLYLDGDGRVHRRLAWGRFVGGKVIALDERAVEDDSLPAPEESSPLPGPWPQSPRNP